METMAREHNKCHYLIWKGHIQSLLKILATHNYYTSNKNLERQATATLAIPILTNITPHSPFFHTNTLEHVFRWFKKVDGDTTYLSVLDPENFVLHEGS